MSSAPRPVDPGRLPDLLAEFVSARPGIVRVAVDGPGCAAPDALAAALAEPLRLRGRPFDHIHAATFWRDASLRLEFGHQDVDGLATWLDADALRREVLAPLGPGGSRSYLPSLRDPVTNRATREPAKHAADGTVVVVSGELLLGRGLPFDVSVHIALSSAARGRRFDDAHAWTLPAFDRYDGEVRPTEVADVVLRWDDPRHPAMINRLPG